MERMSQDYAPGKKALVLPTNYNVGRIVSLITPLAPKEERSAHGFLCYNQHKKTAWIVESADDKGTLAAESLTLKIKIETPVSIVPQHQLMLLDDNLDFDQMDEDELLLIEAMS